MKQPEADANEDPIDYFPGPIDFAAVDEFLRLLEPTSYAERVDHVGRLAASLATKPQTSSAEDLVRLAMEIQTEAKQAVSLSRDFILTQMNGATVGRLLENLRNLDSARGEVDDREHGPYDSIVKTVADRFKEIHDNPPTRFRDEDIENALSKADSRMKHGQTRPEVPCDLKAALRYIAGGASTPPAALESAFIDFLSLHKLERVKKCDSEEELTLRSQLESNLKIEGLVRKDRKLAANRPVRKFLKAVIQDLRNRLTGLEQRKCTLQTFVPGSKVRDPVFEEMAKLVDSRWKGSDSVSLRTLAWLSVDFYPFWERHKTTYGGQHRVVVTAKKKKTGNAKKAGVIGLSSRESDTFLIEVQDWLKFADLLEKRPVDTIEEFAKKTYRSKPAIKKLSEFLGALHDHVINKTPVKKIVTGLQKKKKLMNEDIFQKCAQELIQYLEKNEKYFDTESVNFGAFRAMRK